MRHLFLFSLLALGTLAACQKKRESAPCYVGTLLGTTCDTGYLVQVDSVAHPGLGQSLVFQGDAGPALAGAALPAREYANVIIVYNTSGQAALYSALQRRQKIYMNLNPAPTDIPRFCPGVPLYDAPKFVLTDYSGSSCPEFYPD